MTGLQSLPERALRLSELEAIQDADGVRVAVPRETCPCCGRVTTFEVVAAEWRAVVAYTAGGWKVAKEPL